MLKLFEDTKRTKLGIIGRLGYNYQQENYEVCNKLKNAQLLMPQKHYFCAAKFSSQRKEDLKTL
jgi:hypothetical protein